MSKTTAATAPVEGDPADAATSPPPGKFDSTITEGPLSRAVWKIAWPTIVTNLIAGMQGMVDQILVGNLVGYQANAAIGVSNQIFILVVVFMSSLFIGMSVLVARFAGAHDGEKVDRTVYQAFLTAAFIGVFLMAPIGYFASPYLLDIVNTAPNVKAEALPFLRITFLFSIGLLIYFMTSGALRSAGDARTPMVIGVAMTLLNLVLNVIFIRGLGPIPAFGTTGSAIGTAFATCSVGIYSIYKLCAGGWVASFPHRKDWAPDWQIIRKLFKFGLPAGVQGVAMNLGGLLMFAFIGSVAHGDAAQAVYSVAYGQLFLLITWSSNGLMGAAASVAGQNLGAGHTDRALSAVHTAARFGLIGATAAGILYFFYPVQLLAIFGMTDETTVAIGTQLLRVLSISGIFISAALTYTGGLQGTGDTKSPLYISIISQVVIPLGICFVVTKMGVLQPLHIWLAILAGHFTRCTLSLIRFSQGKWRNISVDIDASNAPST